MDKNGFEVLQKEIDEADKEIKKLKKKNNELTEDRDLWKSSESTCNREYNELLAQNTELLDCLIDVYRYPDIGHDRMIKIAKLIEKHKGKPIEEVLKDG